MEYWISNQNDVSNEWYNLILVVEKHSETKPRLSLMKDKIIIR